MAPARHYSLQYRADDAEPRAWSKAAVGRWEELPFPTALPPLYFSQEKKNQNQDSCFVLVDRGREEEGILRF